MLIPEVKFPIIHGVLNIDQDLHVHLQYKMIYVPLPHWFIDGLHAKLTTLSMLESFPSYLKNLDDNYEFALIKELLNYQNY